MQGMSFRDAYKEIGEQVQAETYAPGKPYIHQHLGSKDNLGLDQIRAKMEGL